MKQYPFIDTLAAIIVRHAVQEYRLLLKRDGTWHVYLEDDSEDLKELEAFFRSPWCDILMGNSDGGISIMEGLLQEKFGDPDSIKE